jgi:hypothetical protein
LLYPRAVKYLLAAAFALGLVACTSGGNGPDPDPDPGVDAGAGGDLPFMAECTADDQCETGLCFQYNEGPQLCTHECTSALQCEAPSPGCNGMGVCKRPQ